MTRSFYCGIIICTYLVPAKIEPYYYLTFDRRIFQLCRHSLRFKPFGWVMTYLLWWRMTITQIQKPDQTAYGKIKKTKKLFGYCFKILCSSVSAVTMGVGMNLAGSFWHWLIMRWKWVRRLAISLCSYAYEIHTHTHKHTHTYSHGSIHVQAHTFGFF